MKKLAYPHSSASSSLFSSSPLLLFFLILLAACSSPQQSEPPATEPASVTEPTDVPPATPTPQETPEPPTETPEPTFTPTPEPIDLLQIVYIDADGNPTLWNEATGSIQLASMGDSANVRISDDGNLIAFVHDLSFSEQELWAVNADGSNLQMLMGAEDFQALDPAALGVKPYQVDWIPGTHVIAFNTVQQVDGPGLFLYDDLYFYDVDANDLSIQLTSGTGGNFVFSPDGLQYAVIQPETISLLNTDGANIREDVLTYPYVLTYSEYQYYAQPVWSSDSTFLRVAIPPQDSLSDPEAVTLIWEIPTDGTLGQQFAEIIAQPFFVDPVHLSPDLTKIAFTRLPDPADFLNSELVIANSDGSNETVYAVGNLFISGWSLDSQQFIFEDSLLQETYLGSLDTTPTLLTDSPHVWNATWLDETRFIFSVQTDTGWELRLGTVGQPSVLLAELSDGIVQFDFDK